LAEAAQRSGGVGDREGVVEEAAEEEEKGDRGREVR
jgi:hypothetical protein